MPTQSIPSISIVLTEHFRGGQKTNHSRTENRFLLEQLAQVALNCGNCVFYKPNSWLPLSIVNSAVQTRLKRLKSFRKVSRSWLNGSRINYLGAICILGEFVSRRLFLCADRNQMSFARILFSDATEFCQSCYKSPKTSLRLRRWFHVSVVCQLLFFMTR